VFQTSVPPTTYPHTTHTTHAPQLVVLSQWIGTTLARVCATAVGWLLIMTTVGKTRAVKYTKEATLTKLIHY